MADSDSGPRARPNGQSRCLLGIEGLEAHPDAGVLLVQGEAAYHAAAGLFKKNIVLSWDGAPQLIDWTPLAARTVTIWPNADDEGWNAAQKLRQILGSLRCTVSLVDAQGADDGWDAPGYHAGWNISHLIASGADSAAVARYIKAHRDSTPIDMAAGLLSSPEAQEEVPEDPGDPRQEELSESSGLAAVAKRAKVVEIYGLETGPGGWPWANMNNAMAVISQHPDTIDALWFDEFKNRVMIGEREFERGDASELNLMMQRHAQIQKMSTSTVEEACTTYAKRRRRHPVREWLASLPPWDQVERLDVLLSHVFGTPQDDYHAAVGRGFLIGMVARIMRPGCQLDTMPVFEGAQGIGKTSALRILGGQWYSSNNAGMNEKDFLQGLHGFWLIEVEEMDGVNRASLEKTKAIISRERDDFRWSHGKSVLSYDRQCVFAGTTNSDMWNMDDSGARRFLPVACQKVELEWLRVNREQLFAQALVRFNAGEAWWRVPVERARQEQEARHLDDPWAEDIGRMLGLRQSITVTDVFDAFEIPHAQRVKGMSMRVGAILKRAGWRSKVEWYNGGSQRVYRPPQGRAIDQVTRLQGDGDDRVPF